MNRTVDLPLWLLILILAFAAVTFSSHFLFPSVRWFFRKRMERVVTRLNKRLARPIEPFKLARRHDTIQRLIYDPEVAQAILDYAEEEGVPEAVAFEKAHRYAREIVPGFSTMLYFGFATRVARLISQYFYKVRIGTLNLDELEAIPADDTVIFVINHRSNFDYVLLTWLVSQRSALAYAAGEWARPWPLGPLVRAMGAYFIRRKSLNPLYRKVLSRYVQLATQRGLTQAVFPEGGLSLNGRVGEAKMGLLNYVISGFDPDGPRDVVFVPVALNYDRVPEDNLLVRADVSGRRKFRLGPAVILRHVVKHLIQKILGRFHRFGYALVNFGEPLSLRDFCRHMPGDPTEPLAHELMERIRTVVPVLPVPMVSTLLCGQDGQTLDEINARFGDMAERLRLGGAYVHQPREGAEPSVESALDKLMRRGLLREEAGRYAVTEIGRPLLAYYANSIAHLVDAAAAKPAAIPADATSRAT